MKKWLFAVAALPLFAAAQTTAPQFIITGKIGNVNAPAKAYLVYKSGVSQMVDSANVVNGAFTVTGTVAEPNMAQLAIDHKGVGIEKLGGNKNVDVLTFILSNSDINIVSNNDSVTTADVSDLLNSQGKELNMQLLRVENDANKLNAEYRAASAKDQNSIAFKNALQARATVLQEQRSRILKNFITSHTNSYVSLIALRILGSRSPDVAELERLYSLLSSQLKSSEAGMSLKLAMDATKPVTVGSVAPEFTQNDANGKPVSLSSFKGKYVLIDFWASWCGPCRQENPNVVKAYNKYKNKKFTILGVSLDKPDARNSWLAAIKNDGLVWTQVSDLNFWNNEVARLYHISAIPANFLLDPEGKIIARDLRGADLDKKLSEIL